MSAVGDRAQQLREARARVALGRSVASPTPKTPSPAKTPAVPRKPGDEGLLEATAKLLCDSVQEQGRLRAQLEAQTNPKGLIDLCRSHLMEEFGYQGLNSAHVGESVELSLQVRGALLQLELQVQDLVRMRKELDTMKSSKTKVEALLAQKQAELSQCQHALEICKRELKNGVSRDIPRDGLSSGGAAMRENTTLPPKIPQPHYQAAHSVLPPPPPPPYDDDEEEEAAAEPIILDIDIGEGRKATIRVERDADPIMLAFTFLREHALPPDYLEPLAAFIQGTLERSTSLTIPEEDDERNTPENFPVTKKAEKSPRADASQTRLLEPEHSLRGPVSSPTLMMHDDSLRSSELDDSSAEMRPNHNANGMTDESLYQEAVNMFDNATVLATSGRLQEAARLYKDSLKLFERVPFATDLGIIRDEISYWTELARKVHL